MHIVNHSLIYSLSDVLLIFQVTGKLAKNILIKYNELLIRMQLKHECRR